MTKTPEERRAYNAKRAKLWREKNKAKCQEYHKKYSKEYYQSHKAECKEYSKKYYQAHRAKMDAQNRLYIWQHREQINELQRLGRAKAAGRELQPKHYSFARAFIRNLQRNPLLTQEQKTLIFTWLLAIPSLTDHQRELILLTAMGRHTQTEIAEKLHINQSSVTKVWNGCKVFPSGKYYGGIYKKFQAVLTEEMKSYLDSLGLRYQ